MTPVRLEPATLRSRVKHSTTEPLRSLITKMLRILVLFISETLTYSFCACVRNTPKIVEFVIGKIKLVSFTLFLDASPPPPRPKMPFTYVVNVYSDMSLSKGHLGSSGGGGGASKNKLKYTSFIFPMTNVTILGVFRTHAQKECGKVWEMKSTFILNI